MPVTKGSGRFIDSMLIFNILLCMIFLANDTQCHKTVMSDIEIALHRSKQYKYMNSRVTNVQGLYCSIKCIFLLLLTYFYIDIDIATSRRCHIEIEEISNRNITTNGPSLVQTSAQFDSAITAALKVL